MSITVYSESSGPIGQTIYTFVGVTAPAQFVPRLVATTKRNNAGTNIDYRVAADYPIISTVDGKNVVTDTFRAHFSFTALQSVINMEERGRLFDEVVAFLVKERDHILDGNVRKTA